MPGPGPTTAGACLAMACLALGVAARADAQEFELGGPRKPRATITADGDDDVVDVRFLPVAAFDPATNARLNRGKGRDYALRALAARAPGERTLDLSGGEVTKSGLDGEFYRLTYRVARAGLGRPEKDEPVPDDPPPDRASGKGKKRSPFPARSALFTRKDDFLDTLERLRAHHESEAERASLLLADAEYSARLREIREAATRDFDRLAGEVREDRLLNFVERDEIAARLKKRRDELMARLASPDEADPR